MTQKTLLDEFAMAALPALIKEVGFICQNRDNATQLTTAAYEMANAMMKERQKYETATNKTSLTMKEVSELVQPSAPLWDDK